MFKIIGVILIQYLIQQACQQSNLFQQPIKVITTILVLNIGVSQKLSLSDFTICQKLSSWYTMILIVVKNTSKVSVLSLILMVAKHTMVIKDGQNGHEILYLMVL